MYVLFDNNGREYLRLFEEISEDVQKLGIFINGNNVPVKDNYTTVIYRNSDGTIKYEFEPINEVKHGK